MINGRRPFTEMFEVCQAELCREAASNQDDKYKGFINQVYVNELSSILPELYLKKEGFITTVAEYTTGTVQVGTGTAGVHGVLTTFTTAHTNRWISVDGANNVFRVTYSADTFLTFNNSLAWVEASFSTATVGYTLFQDRYQLASDFSYLLADNPEDPNVVSRMTAGSKLFLDPWTNEEYDRSFIGETGDIHAYTVKWETQVPYMFLFYAPGSVQDIISYWYIPVLLSMTEYTTGTVTFATSTAIVGAGCSWLLNVTTGTNTYYIRNDADGTGSSSKWQLISSVANATALTLSSAWSGSTGTSASYTISEISKWPARFDDAILYKAAAIADPDNMQLEKWVSLYTEAVSLDRTVETKRKTASQWKRFPGRR